MSHQQTLEPKLQPELRSTVEAGCHDPLKARQSATGTSMRGISIASLNGRLSIVRIWVVQAELPLLVQQRIALLDH